MNQFNIALDLDKSTARTPPTVRLRQGDQDGTVIAATIYDHGAALGGTVTACAIVMKLPDGTHYYRKGATWAGGVATVTVDERQAASVVGRTMLAYFTVTVGTAQYSTGAFAVVVEPDAVGDAELPEDYDTAIQEAIDRCNAAAAALEGALPIGTNNLANGAVTADKLADAVRNGYVRSFETVPAMQAAMDLEAGMTCHTNGFHTSSDGGAAYYTVSATGTANGMDVLACQGGLFATLVVTEPYVMPEQFGAYGDGTHDDTASLIAAFSKSGKVVGKEGSTYLTTSIVRITGKTARNMHVYHASATTRTSMFYFTECDVHGCTFESTNDNEPSWEQATGKVSNIFINAAGSTFRDCEFLNLEYVACAPATASDDEVPPTMNFDSCRFMKCCSGITANAVKNGRISNCTFNMLDYATILSHSIYLSNDCANWVIEGCHIKNDLKFPLAIGNAHDFGENPKDILIKDCYVESCIDLISTNGTNIVFDNLTVGSVQSRYILGGGSLYFRNTTLKAYIMFALTEATTFPNGEPYFFECHFDNCVIKPNAGGNVVVPWTSAGPLPTNHITIYSKNTTWELKDTDKPISTSTCVHLESHNDVFKDMYAGFGNDLVITEPSESSVFELLFKGCTFFMRAGVNGNCAIYNAYGGTIDMMDCYIINDEIVAPYYIITRPNAAYASDTTLRAANVTFKNNGEWVRPDLSGFQHNVYNSVYRNTTEDAWMQRTSEVSGAATIVSVKGNTAAQDGELLSVNIDGVESVGAALTIPVSTYFPNGMRSAGNVRDELTATQAVTRVGAVDLGSLYWRLYGEGTDHSRFSAQLPGILPKNTVACAVLTPATNDDVFNHVVVNSIAAHNSVEQIEAYVPAYSDAATFKAAMSGVMLYYALATPTTTPIEPTLNLTYPVVQGSAESIVVPTGKQSAPPIMGVTYVGTK